MSNPVKTAIIGFGVAGKFMHAPFVKTRPEQYDVIAVLERHQKESATLFPGAVIARSIEALLAIEDIELVIITTPNETHFPYAKASLLAGKHVVVDKPFTITSAEAQELITLSQQVGKVISVYQNRRYVSDFLTIKRLLHNKLLGDVHEFEAHYDRYRPEAKPNAWREEPAPGSGILYDLGAHLIDQAFYLFGLPQEVTADIRLQRPHARTVDNFELKLGYGFTKVILKSGMLVREPGPRYMIHGTLGSFVKYGEDPQEVYLRAGKLPTEVENWGQEDEQIFGTIHTDLSGHVFNEKYPSIKGDYGYYYENLYKTIREGIPLRERPEHAFNVIKLIELAEESSKEKRTIACTGFIAAAYPRD
ncbi:Gfo/Idh/MocA family oxidoreductase [Panacibacter sp. DH6]|uniref:Gfo/Idh/MocA family oxidoreductase n=1 Tax=Panacibacter microcysteis TaxID=2793269 RepID=A0A931GWJ6_9BACT|nr:Gfo/Idh/MocA family oxidoreductase [Panacibacter microcysteis]MBG9377740.1 Gfo/Idh/MocA family oxidoreductase [Panacibacter microcysteis]